MPGRRRAAEHGGYGRGRGRLGTEMDGLPVKAWIAIGVGIAVVVLAFGGWWTYGLDRGSGGMSAAGAPRVPPVAGYYDGEAILFLHTEASDEETAEMLTGMMGSPVVTVAALRDVPESALARVYVFTNGVRPEDARGPMGYQADVFDSAPPDEAYTPLRAVVLVTWRHEADARVLTSAAEVEAAVARGQLKLEEPGVVVNMPFLTWPGGAR